MAKVKSLKVLTEGELRKKYPSSSRADVILPDENSLWLPSRNLALNYQLGGGIPYGKILEIMGYESTGKSLLAKDFAYGAQALGGMVLWADAERSFQPLWATANGLELDKIEVYENNDIEGMSDWARDMVIYYRSILTNNEPILFVIDSIAALDCFDNLEADQTGGKAEMGNRAKAIYKMYRQRNSMFADYGVCVIAINQVREKVGAGLYEASTTTPGGAATKFYASQRLALVRSKQIKGLMKDGKYKQLKEGSTLGKKVGQKIIIKCEKNKVAAPKPSFYSEVYFTPEKFGYPGYCKYAGLPEILKDLKIIKIKGANHYYKETRIANSADNMLQVLHDDEELRKKLVSRSPINTIGKTQAKLDAISINMFKVKLAISKQNEDSDEE